MGTLHEDKYTFLIISPSVLLRMRSIPGKFIEEIKTHFVFGNFFSRKSCHLSDNVENYCRTGQPTDDNIAHAYCLLYT